MNKFKWDARYLYAGVTALLVIFCCIVFFMIFQRWEDISAGIANVFTILTPFIWGLVFAYLFSPLMNYFQRKWYTNFATRFSTKVKTRFAIARGLSVFSSILLVNFFIIGIILLLWPRLEESVINVTARIPEYIISINDWVLGLFKDYPDLRDQVGTAMAELTTNFQDIGALISSQLPEVTDFLSVISSSIFSVITVFLNLFLGVIISCYILYNKEKFGGQFKRLMYSVFTSEHVDSIYSTFRFMHKVFMGFIGGKLIDSLIIGILCYIGCVILQMPYAPLIAVIIGVTNIIPYFGPFIGAIPSAFIIIMESPVKGLIFAVFILALQQFDGNILGPRILGNSVGISGFWVMFSILVGSGLFGFTGMLVGVPLFVIISTGINILIKNRLRKKGLPTNTSEYVCISHIDPKSHRPVRNVNVDIPDEIIEEL